MLLLAGNLVRLVFLFDLLQEFSAGTVSFFSDNQILRLWVVLNKLLLVLASGVERGRRCRLG